MKGIIRSIFLCILIVVILAILLIYKQQSEPQRLVLDLEDSFTQDDKLCENSDVNLIVLKVAHYFPESHPQHIALSNKFATIVEKKSNGKIRVELFPNNKLGYEKEYMTGVINGTIEMCVGNQSLLESINELTLTKLPYVFENYEDAVKILNTIISPSIEDKMRNLGIHNLGWVLNGFNQISIKNKNNELKMILATREDDMGNTVLDYMGYKGYKSNITEIDMLLNQGVVSGHDFPLLLNFHNRWYSFLNELYVTNHVLSCDMYIINEEFYKSLSREYQNLITEAIEETAKYEVELLKNVEQDIYKIFEKEGISIYYPDLSVYKRAVKPLYDQFSSDNNELKNLIEEVKRH